ncbi:MAG: hypothetical protein LUD68_07885, partial [Rikenellaceae bacterium]|nr:hypothetical protein [Rikenellaceae bacterium]
MKDRFDVSLADSQATPVKPLAADRFDFGKYSEYEAFLRERCENFWKADQEVLVYRRMRVREVFAADAADRQKSLEWQLG